jgi:heme exporter protein C
MKNHWWKALGVLMVAYSIVAGFLLPVPRMEILHETIRNLYFHVTMWFSMIIILTASLVGSIMYLNKQEARYDSVAVETAQVGILFGILGVSTGSLWANFTWGDWWVNDAKLNGAAITLLFYFAYMILRGSVDEPEKRARISAVYNIFSYVMLIVFLLVLPRMTDSLHPGNGGNPGFGKYDLDNGMRMVFYPAIIGWSLMGTWLVSLGMRIRKLNQTL